MEDQSSRIEFLLALAAEQGVQPSPDDLAAVIGFLDTLLPELERLEGLLDRDDSPAEGVR
jgi:hypothetical protein